MLQFWDSMTRGHFLSKCHQHLANNSVLGILDAGLILLLGVVVFCSLGGKTNPPSYQNLIERGFETQRGGPLAPALSISYEQSWGFPLLGPTLNDTGFSCRDYLCVCVTVLLPPTPPIPHHFHHILIFSSNGNDLALT